MICGVVWVLTLNRVLSRTCRHRAHPVSRVPAWAGFFILERYNKLSRSEAVVECEDGVPGVISLFFLGIEKRTIILSLLM